MLRYHTMSERQTDAVTLWFGGEEGNEDALQIGMRNSFTVVFNLNYCRLRCELLFLPIRDLDSTFRLLIGNCFGCITQQVQHYLAQQALVRANRERILGRRVVITKRRTGRPRSQS